MKVCIGCQIEKPLSEFYRHSGMADGHLNKCKVCFRAAARASREAKADYYREYDRKRSSRPDRVRARIQYQGSEAGRSVGNAAKRRWSKANRDKSEASCQVKNAVRDGRLWKAECCTAPGCYRKGPLDAHHTHYDSPLCVVWLCRSCHARLHKEHRERERQARQSNTKQEVTA